VALVALMVGRTVFLEKESEEDIKVNTEDINRDIAEGTNSTKTTTVAPAVQPSQPPEPKVDYITIKGNQYNKLLFEIDLSDMDLTNGEIVSLQYLTNLENLNLGGNQISDLKPLSGLKNLTQLYLYDNKRISDLTPLSNLTNLTRMSLCYNQISDLAPLSKLTKLEWLELGDNQISDLKPLKSLTNLKWVGLKDNKIEDWSPVAHIPSVAGRP
jgi:Leucine-rich repeat (LRR) protein